MANVFAESPSVNRRVQLSLLPAKFAYSSLGMIILLFFIFFRCLSILEFYFARRVFKIMSLIPDFYISVIILFVTSKTDPKFATVVVRVYFV